MKNKWLFFLLLTYTYAFSQRTLTEVEKAIATEVEIHMPATIELLKKSVNINSGTFNLKGVRAVGEIYASELASLGFRTEWISLPDSMKRAGHLVAYRRGKKEENFFLSGTSILYLNPPCHSALTNS